MTNSRIYYSWLYRYFSEKNKKIERVLIYGNGNSGYITKDILQNQPQQIYNIVGFIDDGRFKRNKKINEVNTYSINEISESFILQNNINQIIVSIENTSSRNLIELSEKIERLPVQLRIVPPASKWKNGTYEYREIKLLKIEDLFENDSFELNNSILEENIKNKTVFVTGAAGTIGSEISRQLTEIDFGNLILIDQAESALYDIQQSLNQSLTEKKQLKIFYIVANIRDQKRMHSLFEEFKPHLIFHAAAYKHVPFMETFPQEAINNNVEGTKIIADLANHFNLEKFVLISTDKAVKPSNVMGATKRIAEIYVSSINKISNTNYIITRFGNVLGSNGSVIPLFKKQIKKGGPLTVTDADINRYFMTVSEACNLVLQAGIMGNGGEIFVFDMGKPIKIFDLAKKMIRLSGFKYPEEINIKFIGLRPGEKIFEEVLADDEHLLKTHHEKIMIAKGNIEKYEESIDLIEELCLISSSKNYKNSMELVSKIKKIIPEFKSLNSEFEVLD